MTNGSGWADLAEVATEQARAAWSKTESSFEVKSPADGSVLARLPEAGAAEAQRAVDASAEGFREWKHTPPFERAAALSAWALEVGRNKQGLAELISMEMGKPVSESRGEVEYALSFITHYATQATQPSGEQLASVHRDERLLVSYQPVGPAFGIIPWNFPAAMLTRTVAPAIAAGCSIILKPAEQTPLTALVLERMWQDAGGPPDVFQVAACGDPVPLSRTILDDRRIRKLTFTGSQAVGTLLYQQAAATMKRVSMELGGNAPFLVFEDADIADAAREVLRSKFRISGQTCVCANRIYVHEDVARQFQEAFCGLVSELRLGHPLDEKTDVGPLVDSDGLAKVDRHVRDAIDHGASIGVGGQRQDGLYFAPTVLSEVNDEMLVMREETFGPVAPIASFSSENEAIERANDSPYGLAAYFWTRDVRRVFRLADELEAGIIGGNNGVPGGAAHVPFGGVKDSGVGRAGGRWGLDAYREPSYLALRFPGTQ